MLSAKYDDGSPVPDEVIFQLIMFMTWAGHETTTAQTAWCLTDLLSHPEWHEKARAEVDSVLGGTAAGPNLLVAAGPVEDDRHGDSRIRAAASDRDLPAAGRQRRYHREWLYDSQKAIASSSCPACRIWMPAKFPEADTFRPDRFDPNGTCPANMDSLIGFGGGLHRCLGVNFRPAGDEDDRCDAAPEL